MQSGRERNESQVTVMVPQPLFKWDKETKRKLVKSYFRNEKLAVEPESLLLSKKKKVKRNSKFVSG